MTTYAVAVGLCLVLVAVVWIACRIAEQKGRSEAERARLAGRFDEIAALSRMLNEKEAEVATALDSSRADKEAAERRLAEAERAGRLAEELEAERTRLAARFEEIAGLNKMLQTKEAEVAAALDRTRAEKEAAEGRLAERFGEIAKEWGVA